MLVFKCPLSCGYQKKFICFPALFFLVVSCFAPYWLVGQVVCCSDSRHVFSFLPILSLIGEEAVLL
ncbi:hypothetical protein OIU79_014797 [Salix purpurea]|uniref:Uncharacterized protein n=1 Tax=Salix purpurea TaxID=77065 RepID=A0A9Q0SPD6_SALPP|nr:hypothetical protein OIU79_014797 [Salix purpurea]